MGIKGDIKGEPSTPADPAHGLVWSAIVAQVDLAGAESEFISATDIPRATLGRHPWSIGGGGALDLKERIESIAPGHLAKKIDAIGFFQDTHADDVFVQPTSFFLRRNGLQFARPCIRGDGVRDWTSQYDEAIFFPYDERIEQWSTVPDHAPLRWLWACRTTLWSRSVFGGQTYREAGRPWWDYHQFPRDRARAERLIAFGEIATHNHFVFDHGGKVFNRTAPVIKLPADAGEDAHLGLVGLLNSSVACFWLKQVCFNKGNGGIGGGISDEKWELRYAFNASQVTDFPLTEVQPLDVARQLDSLAQQLMTTSPDALVAHELPTRATLDAARNRAQELRAQMIAQQEELDWRCYRLYGLIDAPLEMSNPPGVALGERAFEIVLARRVAAEEDETTWFERHRSTPITELPAHWPPEYRRLVVKRIALIESDRNIGLIERPEYKRRWNSEPWAELEQRALKHWLFDRLETERYWPRTGTPALQTVHQLADLVRTDAGFMQVAVLYAGRDDFDVGRLAAELVEAEAVPFLPALRYTGTGLAKRDEWEATWALQRLEDEIDTQIEATIASRRVQLEAAARDDGQPLTNEQRVLVEMKLKDEIAAAASQRKADEVGQLPVPPKYKGADFRKSDYWRLRGAMDVPKERFVSYPGASLDADGSLVVAWAGWNLLQQATALANRYLGLKDNHGWAAERLKPVLAGLQELVPWLKQWHNEIDPEHGARMGDYFEGFVQDETRALGTTVEALRAWRPVVTTARKSRRVAA